MHKICQVCGQSGHGNHFGVDSCRACAAFFRRSVVQGRKYVCKRGGGDCNVTGSQKFFCRYCRFRKCISIGMSPENVQWDRDILSTTVKKDVMPGQSPLKTITKDEVTIHCVKVESDVRENEGTDLLNIVNSGSNVRLSFDVSRVKEKLREIFSQDYEEDEEKCLLVRMYHALQKHRSNENPKVKILHTINCLEQFPYWKAELFQIAKWMMNCKEFTELPMRDKELLFKGSWILWLSFERMHMSVLLFGEQAIQKRVMAIVGENAAFNLETVQIEFGPLVDCDPTKMKSMFGQYVRRVTDEVIRPLIDLSLDPYEVSYILNAFVWHVQGKDVKPSTRVKAEEVLDRISDELHSHYTNDLKMPNYAARLTNILSLIHAVERNQHERSKFVELARVFDVVKFDMSEDGIFYY